MNDTRFFICKTCGNVVGVLYSSGVPLICCGEEMQLLEANTVDASREKHVPVITVSGDTVTVEVGSVPHPMVPEHYISFIYLLTEHGGQRKGLSPGQAPKAAFKVVDDAPKAVYAYCNIHGLWSAQI